MQHGEQVIQNGVKRAKELGHFIAVVKDNYMQKYLEKFNEQFKGKQYIEIEFCNDNPLVQRYERNNQSGMACYCMLGNTTGSQKTKNGWQPIECNENCQYRQKDTQGKQSCNRVGWLKFFIPSICKERIWLMRITSQTSIDRINGYINLIKSQGNSLKGTYILFLKQEKQTKKATNQVFNNFLLDIIRKEDFISNNSNPQSPQEPQKPLANNTEISNNTLSAQKQASTNNKQLASTNVQVSNDKTDEKQTAITNAPVQDTRSAEEPKKTSTKKSSTTSKKETKTKTAKSEEPKQEPKGEYDDCHVLLRTYTEKITNKGQTKDYFMAEFTDMQDNICNVAIKPDYQDELSECELGTVVRLDIQEVEGKKFAIGLEFVEKRIKVAA